MGNEVIFTRTLLLKVNICPLIASCPPFCITILLRILPYGMTWYPRARPFPKVLLGARVGNLLISLIRIPHLRPCRTLTGIFELQLPKLRWQQLLIDGPELARHGPMRTIR